MERRCPQCGFVVTDDSIKRCPRCNAILDIPPNCEECKGCGIKRCLITEK